jgi:hypothetical protein
MGDVCITVPTGKIKTTKTPNEKLEEELKRHFKGVVTSIVKWSKTMEKDKYNISKHESPCPQDQVATGLEDSLDGKE